MFITTSAIALNAAVVFTVWTSTLSLPEKIVLTVVAIGKCCLFDNYVNLSHDERARKIVNAACIGLNIGLIIYSAMAGAFMITLTCAVLLVILLVWSFAVVYDFGSKREE